MTTIYTLTSSLHDHAAVEAATRSFLEPLGIDYKYAGDDFSTYGKSGGLELIFVRTGGTEGLFLQEFPSRPKGGTFYLLASGTSNSLAASMEILSFLTQQGLKGEILHGSTEYLRERIATLEKVAAAKDFLNGKRLGVVGEPSDWLISSGCDRKAVLDKAGIEVLDIPMSELLAEFEKLSPASTAELEKVPCREGTLEKVKSSLEGADRIYRALKELIKRYRLDGLTLRCFDLLTSVGNTGCLALARLNSEGYVATCEGDIPAMLSMLFARALTGGSGFQCNPSRMDPSKGEIVFAHCTLPLSMARSYSFDTHFESGIGVGIHGEIPEGPVTLFKLSGNLGRHFAAKAELKANSYELNLCRTQVLLRLDEPRLIGDYFLKKPIGNHHILLPGDHAAALCALCEAF